MALLKAMNIATEAQKTVQTARYERVLSCCVGEIFPLLCLTYRHVSLLVLIGRHLVHESVLLLSLGPSRNWCVEYVQR
jgi:hypothetical protein